jgi:mono/diheme cytochrome c family protein
VNRKNLGQTVRFVAVLLFFGAATATTGYAAPQSENAQNGKQLFAAHRCAACHGANAQGGAGPRLAPPPVEFPGFVKQVRSPEGEMPPFAPDEVPDSDLTAIYAFLKSAQPSQASAAAPTNGNADNGKKLFMADGCYECHGTVGQGSSQTGGARIGPPAISLDAMIAYVHHPSGQMPPYTDKVITDQQMADIYAYLKAQPTPAKNIPLLNQ